jgi:N-acyl-D-amino-acid deacylase
VRDGRIVSVGTASGAFDEEIDAEGRVLWPGFVDIHTHNDVTIFDDLDAASRTAQAVTTVVAGNCGTGSAPRDAAAMTGLAPLVESGNLGSPTDRRTSL